MLIKRQEANAFDFHGLGIADFGQAVAGMSLALITVPPGAEHPWARSTRCAKAYLVLAGCLRFDVAGIAHTAQQGDVVAIPIAAEFRYFNCSNEAAELALVHCPPFDREAEELLPDELRTHDVTLRGKRVMLRPMTEADWPILEPWEQDPEVLHWSDAPGTAPRTLPDIQSIFRGVARTAYVFIVELGVRPIGYCWLQQLNLPEILDRFPGRDLRRIDIAIGAKKLWGQGCGTDAIHALVRFASDSEHADGIYADILPTNPRSRAAFRKAGFSDLEGATGMVVWRQSAPGEVP